MTVDILNQEKEIVKKTTKLKDPFIEIKNKRAELKNYQSKLRYAEYHRDDVEDREDDEPDKAKWRKDLDNATTAIELLERKINELAVSIKVLEKAEKIQDKLKKA